MHITSTCRAQVVDLGRAVAQLAQYLVGVLTVIGRATGCCRRGAKVKTDGAEMVRGISSNVLSTPFASLFIVRRVPEDRAFSSRGTVLLGS